MKTAISIPDPLFKKAEETARKLGVSRSKLFSMAIQEFLRDHFEQDVTQMLDKLYDSVNSRLDEQIEVMQADSLTEEQW